MIAWVFIYLVVGAYVFDFWRKYIAHKWLTIEDKASMLPPIILFWPIVIFYYRDYL